MSEVEPSYRRRNIALAVFAGVIVIGAVFRMMQSAQPEPVAEPAGQPTAAPASRSPAEAGPPLDVEVSYSGAIDALPGTAKIYVFVRPVGERMPLGVQTFGIRDLPVAVAFTPVAGTADAQKVEVVARLSMSGEVSMQPGDLESVSAPLQFGVAAQRVRLTLGTAGSTAPPPADAATGALRVAVRVSLGAGVSLPATTTVFVIVRPSDGTPMPLAVRRFALSDLPVDVTLSDADAMVPGRSISGAGSVEIVARASVSGNVKAEPGDYEARSGALPVAALSAPVVLAIDKRL